MPLHLARLATRAVVRLDGDDAPGFLQSLVTCDIDRIGLGEAGFGALLSPQGKIIFDFHLRRTGPATFLLDVEADAAGAIVSKLKLYRLRAKVGIAPFPDLCVWAAWGEALLHPLAILPEGGLPDPRLKELGIRIIAPALEADAFRGAERPIAASEADYRAHRHLYGVPEGRAELGEEKLFALEANLEELHGVSLKKGCYVGQELTSRMKHKAELKKRLLPFSCERAADITAGAEIVAGERVIGQAVGGSGETVFALIRLDRLDGVLEGDLPVTTAGHGLRIHWPAAYLAPPPR